MALTNLAEKKVSTEVVANNESNIRLVTKKRDYVVDSCLYYALAQELEKYAKAMFEEKFEELSRKYSEYIQRTANGESIDKVRDGYSEYVNNHTLANLVNYDENALCNEISSINTLENLYFSNLNEKSEFGRKTK